MCEYYLRHRGLRAARAGGHARRGGGGRAPAWRVRPRRERALLVGDAARGDRLVGGRARAARGAAAVRRPERAGRSCSPSSRTRAGATSRRCSSAAGYRLVAAGAGGGRRRGAGAARRARPTSTCSNGDARRAWRPTPATYRTRRRPCTRSWSTARAVHVHFLHAGEVRKPDEDALRGMVEGEGGALTFHVIDPDRIAGLPAAGEIQRGHVAAGCSCPSCCRTSSVCSTSTRTRSRWRRSRRCGTTELADNHVAAVTNVLEPWNDATRRPGSAGRSATSTAACCCSTSTRCAPRTARGALLETAAHGASCCGPIRTR